VLNAHVVMAGHCTDGKVHGVDNNCYCPIGHQALGSGCEPCPVGSWKNVVNQAACQTCIGGKTTSGTGSTASTDCNICKAGYGGDAPTTGCTACVADTYKATDGNGACTACPAGSGTSGVAPTTCNKCKAGYGGTAPACQPCGYAKYSYGGTGTVLCTNCPSPFSTLGEQTPSYQCYSCQPGYGPYSAGCPGCAVGKSKYFHDPGVCTDCGVGFYQPSTGQSVCIDCHFTRSTSTQGSTSESQCKCVPGKEPDPINPGQCRGCDEDMYQPLLSNTACLPCPPNSRSAGNTAYCTCDEGYNPEGQGGCI